MKKQETTKHEATDDCHWKTNSIPFAKETQSNRNANASKHVEQKGIATYSTPDMRTELFSR